MARPPRRAARRLAVWLALPLAAWLALPPAQAQEATPAVLDGAGKVALAEAERYLDGIRSLKARFFQEAPGGDHAEGVIYLRRPGRLRVEYAPPVPVLIVGDGFLLHYHDRELGQINEWVISDTPLGILAGEEIRFGEDLTVTALARAAGRLEITVVRGDDPGAGSLALIFEETPLTLRQWRVTDPQGQVTVVSLFDLETNIALKPALFVFDDPREKAPVR